MEVLILGASARAAAHSALRAGWVPRAADLFADRDLAACSLVDRISRSDYPHGLEAISDRAPSCPWFFTGALENHPDLVDRISRRSPLLGCNGSELRIVRDPFVLKDVLGRRGLPYPEVHSFESPPALGDYWLRKPLASAAGAGITVVDQDSPPVKNNRYYYQKHMIGDSFSALYWARGPSSKLIGVCKQIVGDRSNPFRYRGGVAPWPVPSKMVEALQRFGEALVQELGLCWLFGIDFIIDAQVPWPVEVNPRYTASVELYERAARRSLLANPEGFDGMATRATVA